jgi:hypothetical protein
MAYTTSETAAINLAWSRLIDLCEIQMDGEERANRALKLERAQAAPTQKQPVIWARARVLKCWYEGATAPDAPMRELSGLREGVLVARVLGVEHADMMKYAGTGRQERWQRLMDVIEPAVEAYKTSWRRELDAMGKGKS